MPKGNRKVDKRAVPNPIQARTLLAAVREAARSGERLEAFFGTMYFSALRPEGAAALNKRNLDVPLPTWNEETEELEYGWGMFHLDEVSPHIGARWTDDGTVRDRRGLKSRAAWGARGRSRRCAHTARSPVGEARTLRVAGAPFAVNIPEGHPVWANTTQGDP
jgi:hypothetical protein